MAGQSDYVTFQSILFSGSIMGEEWKVKEETIEEEGREDNLATYAVEGESRGVKRKADDDFVFSDFKEEEEEKPSRPSLSPILNVQQLLPSTHAAPSILPPDPLTKQLLRSTIPLESYTTIEEGGETKYRCEICRMVTGYLHNLKAHMRSHMDVRPFGCETCGTRFFRSEHLKRHQRGQCGSRPHLCAICGKRFAEEQVLKDHMILHEHQRRTKGSSGAEEGGEEKRRQFERNAEGMFECPHCTLKYKHACHIDRHMRTHTGERPFRCDECGKGFSQMISFVQHKRVHSGELPFACSLCDQRFRTQGSLNVHRRKTHEELLYVCQSCGEMFKKPTELKEHRLVKHGEELRKW